LEQKKVAAVILAAGKGTRMKSNLPKALHPVLSEPMIWHTVRAAEGAGVAPENIVIVVGFGGELVKDALKERGNYTFVEQTELLGTGHAVMMALPALEKLGTDAALVYYGDNPLLRAATLEQLQRRHAETNPLVTLATAQLDDATGYGRIVRDPVTGFFSGIVEELDCTAEQRAITEFNPGVYLFQTAFLQEALPKIKKSPKGEYYLTDVPGFAVERRADGVATFEIAAVEVLGVNDRVQLAQVSEVMRQRILTDLMLGGVTITDPANTYIAPDVTIGQDSIIEPNTHIAGRSIIGANCVIGPNSLLRDALIGDNCRVLASVVEQSTLENDVAVGPYSRVRPGCHLERGAYIGNFAEASRSRIGANTKQGHFSFIGDATLGADVNIGAGTITANYDGVNKHKTEIGDRVFIGSDSVLRAPLTIGDDARTGAGSIVTKNVEPGVLVVGMPARPIRRKVKDEGGKDER
jgi:bifunctional UDP-N-acetylglucosamine pyrophosphorylase / glucosamine-1-phosphate N-acetyltransferase